MAALTRQLTRCTHVVTGHRGTPHRQRDFVIEVRSDSDQPRFRRYLREADIEPEPFQPILSQPLIQTIDPPFRFHPN